MSVNISPISHIKSGHIKFVSSCYPSHLNLTCPIWLSMFRDRLCRNGPGWENMALQHHCKLGLERISLVHAWGVWYPGPAAGWGYLTPLQGFFCGPKISNHPWKGLQRTTYIISYLISPMQNLQQWKAAPQLTECQRCKCLYEHPVCSIFCERSASHNLWTS